MPGGKASGWPADSGAGYGLTRRAAAPSQPSALPGQGAGEVMGVDQGPGVRVLEDPLTNKGTAFSEEERSELGLRGHLLPAVVETLWLCQPELAPLLYFHLAPSRADRVRVVAL